MKMINLLMKNNYYLNLELATIIALLIILAGEITVAIDAYNRHDFPSDFIFGSSTSAYQVEGAAFEDGRTPSIFDTYAHSGRFVPGNTDVTSDEYRKYKEDVQLMKETGLDAYRFSISWSRLIPDGKGHVNTKGVEYYNNLINELIDQGIQPHITLVHFDIPQALEDEYGGFLSRKIIGDFTTYAEVCFREFGDRVRHWTTVNEANLFILGGYDFGNSPPCRCSSPFGSNCTVGNSSTEPYLAAHNLLLAHASIAKLYKDKYQAKQRGFLGFSIYAFHFIPFNDTKEDLAATQRCKDFFIDWMMRPLMYGDYPDVMKKNVGIRLPSFTKSESELVKGSYDFIGLNYYTVVRTKDTSNISFIEQPRDVVKDMAAEWIYYNEGSPLQGSPYPITPWGLRGVLEHFKQVYDNPIIFIHENGQVLYYNTSINDTLRVDYLQSHIGGLLEAVRNGSNTKGYFVWSFMDMYELLYGYRSTMGLYYVDFKDPDRTRYPKLSQKWYSQFLKGKNVIIDGKRNEQENLPTINQITPLEVDVRNLSRNFLLNHQSS